MHRLLSEELEDLPRTFQRETSSPVTLNIRAGEEVEELEEDRSLFS